MEQINYIVYGSPSANLSYQWMPQSYGDYILKHLQNLFKLKHNCSVTLVIHEFSYDFDQISYFNNVIKHLQKEIDVRIVQNVNNLEYIVMESFLRRKKDYDRYIFINYDYSFCCDDFDKKLCELQDGLDLDVLFALYDEEHFYKILPFMAKHKILKESINNHFGSMRLNRYRFIKAFEEMGFKCGDWRNKYKCEYYDRDSNYICDYSFSNINERICIPGQLCV